MELDDLKNYKLIKKSKLDLMKDEIFNNVCQKLVKELGLYDIYYLGFLGALEVFLSLSDEVISHTCIELLKQFKTENSYSEAIQNVASELYLSAINKE